MNWSYTWRARVDRVVDGDTLDVTIDCGFRATRQERLRLAGINCPETKGATREAGLAATEYSREWLRPWLLDLWPLTLTTYKSDAFGRYLARVTNASGACLNDDLLTAGHAIPFMTSEEYK